jgi:hypothetical protein
MQIDWRHKATRAVVRMAAAWALARAGLCMAARWGLRGLPLLGI